MQKSDTYERIIVLRSGAVGDCVLSTPALAALRRRYPEAFITLLGDPFSAEVFHHSDDVDEIISVDPKRMSMISYLRALTRLKIRGFSLLIDMHGNGRSVLQTGIIGARQRIGFQLKHGRSAVYSNVVAYRMDVHTVLRQAELLRPLGIDAKEAAGPLRMLVTPSEKVEASHLLLEHGLIPGQRYVVMQATAVSWPDLKQWVPDRYAELSDRIQDELGLPVVLTGHSVDDQSVVEKVLGMMRRPVINLFGQTRLRTLGAIIKGASLYVGCDTGPMHIAAAMGTPIVALFGPSDPVRWRPWPPAKSCILRAGLECSPCTLRECPLGAECMRAIQVDEVMMAVRSMLSSARSPDLAFSGTV